MLDRLLDRLSELGFLRAGGRMRTDATLRDTPRSGSRTVLPGWVQVVMAWMATAGGMRAPSFALSGR